MPSGYNYTQAEAIKSWKCE